MIEYKETPRFIIDLSNLIKIAREEGYLNKEVNLNLTEELETQFFSVKKKLWDSVESFQKKYDPVHFLEWALKNSIDKQGKWSIGKENDRKEFDNLTAVFYHYLETQQ